MTRPEPVAVTSRSFSKHPVLRAEISQEFENVRFNDEGLSLSGDELAQFLSGCEFAVTALETIDDNILEQTPELRYIAKIGVGTDMIDIGALERHGVELLRSEGTNANAVAELTLMLILACLRRLPEGLALVADGEWSQPKGRELRGLTVGIVGFGHVGKAVARIVEALGCRVLVYDPEAEAIPEPLNTGFDTVLAESDIVTLHAPLTPETRHMIAEPQLERMREDAVLVNTARGGLIDETALVCALRDETIGYAALDVVEDEPTVDSDLSSTDRLLLTPHVGGSTEEAIVAMGRAAIASLASTGERRGRCD